MSQQLQCPAPVRVLSGPHAGEAGTATSWSHVVETGPICWFPNKRHPHEWQQPASPPPTQTVYYDVELASGELLILAATQLLEVPPLLYPPGTQLRLFD